MAEAPGATLFVKYVPEPVTEVDLALDFSQYGTVSKAVLHSRRFAYIHFLDRLEALYAMTKMDQSVYRGKPLSVVLAASKRKRVEKNYVEYPIIVSNVPTTADKESLLRLLCLKSIDVVHRIYILGESRGNKKRQHVKIVCTEDGYADAIKMALREAFSCKQITAKPAKTKYTAVAAEKPTPKKKRKVD